ncbi:L-threonine dehydratase catabolic TdcB [uncultured Flavonifractor sp.]|uniref:L-threonine dehydratase catabolic TdcB n=1 Tax=Flintibacter hominis TaxID=2763048 RepID=A0A8J6M5V9_9FIRM|nr:MULTISPECIES: threonine ammonia-lyase [Eubacteriales]MBS5589689.1 threonine ammonia-lyase [Clostridiales bacterium]SCH86471.1 L-threonine dehydratase catabolic TdcB [uncultured Clostridium sp.]SCI64097.1 L-threonine dehydratase catabolic TdcB [uncultured Flavonifractor sp.]MBC5721223.1 threonine ammonia-lyase [Flintibacter hominis]MCH1980540.1 threonine ammonia-lyase [Lawsonibacter sp. OA9]
MLTLEQFKNARSTLQGVLRPTPLIYSPYLSKTCGNYVYLKPENMQVTGAYKLRGAYFKISTLTDEEKARGLVTASAGNHAQGVAYAAQAAGVAATIVMPTTTPLVKVNNTKDYGAQVILHGEVFDDAAELAARMAEEQGLTYVHPFNDLTLATGQGTIAYEIFQDLPDVDVILVPIGGGGLAAGVATLAKLLNPQVEVVGVEPTGAASMKASLEAGHIVTLPSATTIADGVAVKTPGDKVFPYIQQNVDRILTIDDGELVEAFLDVMERHKMVVENAGLLTVAALRHLDCKEKNVVSVLSGGNMDVITMASLVQHGLICRGRIFTFAVQLPDRPGELMRVAGVLSQNNGNIIKLEHNQFVNINRQSGVELRVTLEAFGHDHKAQILDALRQAGYQVSEVDTGDFYT